MKKKVTKTALDKTVKKKSMKVPICRNSLPPHPILDICETISLMVFTDL